MSSIFNDGFGREQDPFAKLRSLDPSARDAKQTGTKQQDRLTAASRRFRRPAELSDLIRKLDLYTDETGLRAAVDWIKQQYTVHDLDMMVGTFSRCYLGRPYVDHRMTIMGSILEHYSPQDPVPRPYDAARSLAANPSYDYIEVYADGRLVPILMDGTAADPTGSR